MIPGITIRFADKKDRKNWDGYAISHQDATPYHLFAWGNSVLRAYRFKTFFILAEKGQEVVGILSLSLLKAPFAPGNLVALPYCDVGGVLANDTDIQNRLIEKAIQLGEMENINTIELRGQLTDSRSFEEKFPFQSHMNKVRMLLSLPGSSEALWNNFKSKLRSQIRKSETNGLSFQWEHQAVDHFYAVFTQNMRDLGSPVHSKEWFESILSEYQTAAKVGIVYAGTTPIGAGIILRVGNKISIPWASTLREHNRRAPNMLLYWKLLEHAADSGAGLFDFGRSTPNEGTYKFKSQWGATPVPLTWHKIFLRGSPTHETFQPSKSREHLASMWQKLPQSLTNYLGPKIRKHISL